MLSSCPACGRESSTEESSCPFCKAPRGVSSLTATGAGVAVTDAVTMESPVVGAAPPLSPSTPPGGVAWHGDLTPGALVGGRYRIVALLGRGGMGEVYRADDLTLGQAVALKFLPRSVERDPSRLERFLNEVRTAREVSHPNVCRVHDVGEVNGRHFLSMEYIDGEDLASLLRRIGRLPSDKALEIARQLCAGLAAAHDRGVLHRDLKPANVMLDGRGRVRLTDFGLAETAGAERSSGFAGTPSYMAPEQFEGQPASVLTDVYALGLVLYEVFTGKRVYDAETIGDLRRLHDESRPPSLSTVIRDGDPAVERVIHRCLERDPKLRPVSAIAVAAALPGGDPLAAALAAGETPSPAMVAAAGSTGGLRPGVAAAWFVSIVASLLVVAYLGTLTSGLEAVPKPFSPEVLAVKAEELMARLGYAARTGDDSAWALEWDAGYLQYATKHPVSGAPAASASRAAVRFWLRTSATWLTPQNWDTNSFGAVCKVGWNDPPRQLAAMRSVVLNAAGQLVALEITPPETETKAPELPASVDWGAALNETGIDLSSLSPTPPTWTPPAWADARMAWSGHYPDLPNVPLRVEAAAYRGKITYLQVVAPWTRSERSLPEARTAGDRLSEALQALIILTLLVGGTVIARRNARLGRGDLRGAWRIAAAIAAIFTTRWLLTTHHVADFGELVLLFKGLGATCFMAAWMWVLYVGLEPFVRRRWPHTLIGWSRLLMGRFTDPLVGRDILAGCAGGLVLGAVAVLAALALGADGALGSGRLPLLAPLAGVRAVADLFGLALFQAALNALGLMFLLFLLRLALRRDWLMAVAFIVLMSANIHDTPDRTALLIELGFKVAWALVMVVILARFGLLAFAAAWTVDRLVEMTPLTTSLRAWHAGPTIAALVVVVAVVAAATKVALAGRSLSES